MPTKLPTRAAAPLSLHTARLRPRHWQVILDAEVWAANLPHSIEAIFVPSGLGGFTAMRTHRDFLLQYDLDADEFPLLELRADEIDSPLIEFVDERYR